MPAKASQAKPTRKARAAAPVTSPAARDRQGVPSAGKRATRRSATPDKAVPARAGALGKTSPKKLAHLPSEGLPSDTPTRSEGAISPGAKGRQAMRSVALDLGVRKISFCEVADGEVVRRATVSSLSRLEEFLGTEQAPARVAIEACRESWVVHSRLTQWGNDVLLVDTTRIRQVGIGNHRRKNDRIDAELLARAVEKGSIPRAHLLSPHRQALRRQLSVRRALVETRTQYVTTIRGIAREQGVSLPCCDADAFAGRLRKTRVSEDFLSCIEPLLVALETIQAQLVKADERLEELSAQEPTIQRLTTVPGVGPIIAAAFVSVVDDAKRFRTAHQVEAYLGLVPSEDSSGGKRRLGSITKRGNSYLRALLVQGAWSVLRAQGNGDPLSRWAHQVATRRGKRIAVVAVARRLAGLLWAIWRDETVYDPMMLGTKVARGLRKAAQSIEFQAAALERSTRRAQRQRRQVAGTVEVTDPPSH